MDKNNKKLLDEIKLFKEKIKLFKEKIKSKNSIIVIEPNKFDIFVDNILNLLNFNYKKSISKIVMKNFLVKLSFFGKNIHNFFLGSLKKIFKSINSLEKKIEAQEDLLQKTVKFNQELTIKLDTLDGKINSIIKENLEGKKNKFNQENENKLINNNYDYNQEYSRLNVIQEENLRISNELFESRKKVDIMRQEIDKYNKQRTDLINRINSVNEIVNDSNVLTNVFENNVKHKKIKVLNPSNPIVNNTNLEEEVKNIFFKNK